ncbi:low density lipoprotein receptor adapter protein 1-B-like [Lytechinus pictus]|uniref:low density lipoprotein receptor adapter protein 1-B-like n=1 Tax=Lytechinus pictus TaxID=7653 RepID=UPI0030B9B4BF
MIKNRFRKGKHRKFQDDWEKSHEPVVEGVTFFVKYLGVEIVNLPNDETHTAEAIKKIVHRAKYGSGKVRKVALTVTPTSLKPTDLETNEELEEIVIHRISYCTADKNNDKIFGFISCHFRTEVLECHAYLCQKRKVAEALALTVAQAFNIAYDVWKKSRAEKTSTDSEGKDESISDDYAESSDTSTNHGSPVRKSAPQSIPGCNSTESRSPIHWSPDITSPSLHPPPLSTKILSVQCDTPVISSSAPPTTLNFEKHRPPPLVFNGHVHLDDSNKQMHQVTNSLSNLGLEDDDGDLDDCFSKLAESRSNPGLLDINVKRSPFDADVIVHFSGTNKDRDTLLKSESKDSFFLPNSQDNLLIGNL